MQTDNCSVLFADLVGFSRLVELRQNEVIERQTRLMREITDPLGLKVVMDRCPKIELFRPFWKPRLDLKI